MSPLMKDPKIKVLECPGDAGLIKDLDGMTIEDFESGSWRKKLAAANVDLEDNEFLIGVLETVVVRQVSADDEPPANMIWIRGDGETLEIWKFGADITPN